MVPERAIFDLFQCFEGLGGDEESHQGAGSEHELRMMPGDPQDERRLHARVPIHGRCWCESKNVTLYVQMSNISEEGLFIKTATPLEIGSCATIRLVLPETNAEVEARGEVVWTRRHREEGSLPPGMGLHFVELRQEFRDKLKNYLDTIMD